MSKDFDKEYKELMSEDLPDLWDRIEGNLSTKETKKAKIVKMPFAMRKNIISIAVAACVCIVIVGSGVHLLTDPARFSNKSMAEISDEAVNAYDASDMMSEEMVAGESATEEATTDGAAEEMTAAESVMADVTESEPETEDMTAGESEPEEMATMRSESEEMAESESVSTEAAESEANAGRTDYMAEDTMDSMSDTTEEAADETSGTESVYYDVTVKVVSMENSGEEMIYYGEVINSDGQLIMENNLVMFCISEDAFEPFEIGLTYSLSLEAKELHSSRIPVYIVHEVY